MLHNPRISKKLIVQGIFLVALIVLIFYTASFVGENDLAREMVASYGYVGVFLIALFSGFNLAVPVPAVAFLPLFTEAGLGVWLPIVTIVVGVTIADMIAYYIGRFGSRVLSVRDNGMTAWFQKIQEKYDLAPFVALFLFASLAPLPNELLVIPLGFLGYSFLPIAGTVLAGNFVFNAVSAFGLQHIFLSIF